MDLKQLREKGGFVPPAPVAKEVSWTHKAEDGSEVTDTFVIHVKKLSFGAIEKLLDDKDVDKGRMAQFISDAVSLGEGGKEKLTYKDAFQLDRELARVFLEAVGQVNGTASDKEEKN